MGAISEVQALEPRFRDVLDAVARSRGYPTSREVDALAARVAELSRAYNDPAPNALSALRDGGLAARLSFSFVRDVPKGAAAVRELVATGLLGVSRPLRLLDVGAGLGAMTWGVARALGTSGHAGAIEAHWVDTDRKALELGASIVEAAGTVDGPPPVTIRPRLTVASASWFAGLSAPRLDPELGTYDLVIAGQVLSELDRDEPDDARAERHADLLRKLLSRVDAHGSLVVVEPALRERTRHLHRVRDLLVRGQAERANAPARSREAVESVTLFAPCLHASACPALATEGDWCHEDVPVDLPDWLVPIARGAGLRYQGLTFSYLVLRRDGETLRGRLGGAGAPFRVVSDLFRTKGKREAFLCGINRDAEPKEDENLTEHPDDADLAGHAERDRPATREGVRLRVTRLDRDASATNAAFDELVRGRIVRVAPTLDPTRPRVGKAFAVVPVELGPKRSH
jgi:hypothetical protein